MVIREWYYLVDKWEIEPSQQNHMLQKLDCEGKNIAKIGSIWKASLPTCVKKINFGTQCCQQMFLFGGVLKT